MGVTKKSLNLNLILYSSRNCCILLVLNKTLDQVYSLTHIGARICKFYHFVPSAQPLCSTHADLYYVYIFHADMNIIHSPARRHYTVYAHTQQHIYIYTSLCIRVQAHSYK